MLTDTSKPLILKSATPDSWVSCVLNDFNNFLQDHAQCEHKAFSTGVSLATKNPDKPELCEVMIQLAVEELDHFQRVFRILRQRQLKLKFETRDEYAHQLLKLCDTRGELHFLDRLLVPAVIEARGLERLQLVAEALPPGELKDFYAELAYTEERHAMMFRNLGYLYFDESQVNTRCDWWLEQEARVLSGLPIRAVVH